MVHATASSVRKTLGSESDQSSAAHFHFAGSCSNELRFGLHTPVNVPEQDRRKLSPARPSTTHPVHTTQYWVCSHHFETLTRTLSLGPKSTGRLTPVCRKKNNRERHLHHLDYSPWRRVPSDRRNRTPNASWAWASSLTR